MRLLERERVQVDVEDGDILAELQRIKARDRERERDEKGLEKTPAFMVFFNHSQT